jgi:uncharacterized protein (TIGR02569 family)
VKPIVYGTSLPPPPLAVIEAFGSAGRPEPIAAGQGTAYRAGDLVLKPAEGLASATWLAEAHAMLPESPLVRFARPVQSGDGAWVCGGYVAWTFLEGEHRSGSFEEKLAASHEYHRLLAGLEKPTFLAKPAHSWAAADLVATGVRPFAYDEGFQALYARIAPRLARLERPFQIVHGDLSGNFLLHDRKPPAIIDLSPAWAPGGMAEGIMLADVITWERARQEDLVPWRSLPDMEQLAWRGIVRRIAEQAEHVRFLAKDRNRALEDAREFLVSIEIIRSLFKR